MWKNIRNPQIDKGDNFVEGLNSKTLTNNAKIKVTNIKRRIVILRYDWSSPLGFFGNFFSKYNGFVQ